MTQTLDNPTKTSANREISVTRVLDAPRELVFEASTQPEHVARWWVCESTTMAVCEIDLRPGGAYRFVLRQPDGTELPFRGEYREIVRPERIVRTQVFDVDPWSSHEALVTVTFEDQAGKTLVTTTILFPSPEGREEADAKGMEAGMVARLEGLEKVAQGLAQPASDPARAAIDEAKASFLAAKARLERILQATPDDRINWSPSATARTPIELVAHAAAAVKALHETFDGRTFDAASTAEADVSFREWERSFCTREEVLSLLDANSAAYVAWLDELAPERLAWMVELPFGLGSVPLALALTFPPAHTHSHVAQIDYIQTVYGDHVWHQ
jgi:uncharacterized protein YndB with AHSA1/START domain